MIYFIIVLLIFILNIVVIILDNKGEKDGALLIAYLNLAICSFMITYLIINR